MGMKHQVPVYLDLPSGSKNVVDRLYKENQLAFLRTLRAVRRYSPLTSMSGRIDLHEENLMLSRFYKLKDRVEFPYFDYSNGGASVPLLDIAGEQTKNGLFLIHMGREPGRSKPTSQSSRDQRDETLRSLGYDA